jgi:hypothetical protein
MYIFKRTDIGLWQQREFQIASVSKAQIHNGMVMRKKVASEHDPAYRGGE